MDQWKITLLVMIAAGIIGALSRQFVQWIRDKQWPGQGDQPLFGTWWAELALGAVAGWIAWELPAYIEWTSSGRLGAWALGFVAPDVIENLAQALEPTP